METINERITTYRNRIGLTKKDVALSMGLSYSTYCRMENIGVIKPEYIVRLASVLRVTVNDILYGEDTPELIDVTDNSDISTPELRPAAKQPQLILDSKDYIRVNPQDRKRFALANNMSNENKEFLVQILEKLQNIKNISNDKKKAIFDILDD